MYISILLWFNFLTFNESSYISKTYTIHNGIASNIVYKVVKDNYGRYWIASSGGLQMYDGYQFRTYSSTFGVQSKDLLSVDYYDDYLYLYSLNNIEVIPISSLEQGVKGAVYDFNLINNPSAIFLKDRLYLLYSEYYDEFYRGKRVHRVYIKNPYIDTKTANPVSASMIKDKNYTFLRQLSNSNFLLTNNLKESKQTICTIYKHQLIALSNLSIPQYSIVIAHRDTCFHYFDPQLESSIFLNKSQSRALFKGLKFHNFTELEPRIFFLSTPKGLIQYTEKNYSQVKTNDWNYQQTSNSIFKADKLNLYNHSFKYLSGNNYLSEIETNKLLFSKPNDFLNTNIKSHYVLNDSLILLGYRKGQNTILYNYKTRKIKKEFDPAWVKKVRAEDENNLFILTYDDFRIYKNGVKKVYQLKHKGNYVLTNDLLRSGSRYIYGTNDQGVFISDTNFKFQKHYHQTNGLQSNLIHQLKESGGAQLWLRSEKGIDRILQNGKVERIFAFDEIEDYDIKDFTASQDSLWVFTEKNVYALEYKSRLNPRKIPLLWHNLTVNDTQNFYPIDTNISIGPSWEKLKIEYAGIYLEDQSNIRYRYRIVHNGDTANWIETDQISFVSSSFAPGDYVFQLQAYHQIYPNTCSEIKNITFHIKPYFYQTWWFYGLVLFGSILAALSILYYRNKLKMRTLQAEAELHKATLHGLQTQMNPHFVFNAMNTLQHFILEKDLESSLKYLNEFSSLIRTILDNSSQFEIFLKDEIQFLKKYINVESKRFESQFTSEVIVNIDAGDLQDIKMPPMLIQPLVENAIKHGMPTAVEGKATIRIEFNMDSDTKLDIKIIDNGNREINADNSKSKAINILKERIALIEKRGEKASFHLYRERSETIAHLILPI